MLTHAQTRSNDFESDLEICSPTIWMFPLYSEGIRLPGAGGTMLFP